MYSRDEIACAGRGSMPINASAMPWMMDVSPRLPSPSVYSDQPIRPSSVVTFRNENVLHPASQWRSSILSIFKTFPIPALMRAGCSSALVIRVAYYCIPGVGANQDCQDNTAAVKRAIAQHLSVYDTYSGDVPVPVELENWVATA